MQLVRIYSQISIPDTPGTGGELTAAPGNKGYESRLKFLNNSQTVELMGRLHGDLFNSDKMLINSVDMNIKLTRAPEAFYLLGPSDDTKVRIKIEDAIIVQLSSVVEHSFISGFCGSCEGTVNGLITIPFWFEDCSCELGGIDFTHEYYVNFFNLIACFI
jgi:hypothetical protein